MKKSKTKRTDEQKNSMVRTRRNAEILAEAKSYFVEKGIEHSTMEDIAVRVGVTRQTLYRYYKSKEDLALAVEIEVLHALLGRLNDLFSASAGLTVPLMETIFDEAVVQFIEEYEEELRYTAIFDTYFLQYSHKSYIEQMKETLRSYPNSFSSLISKEQKRGTISSSLDPLLTGEMISHSMLSLCQRVLLRREALRAEYGIDPIVLVPLQLKIFIRGLATPD